MAQLAMNRQRRLYGILICLATATRHAASTVALSDEASAATTASASAAAAATVTGRHGLRQDEKTRRPALTGTSTRTRSSLPLSRGETINDPDTIRSTGRSASTMEPLHTVEYGSLQTSLCEDIECSAECKLYETPLNKCYNGQDMFPGDPSWGKYDVLDTYLCRGIVSVGTVLVAGRALGARGVDDSPCTSFTRTFYASKGSTCQDKTDSFDSVPLKECIGPFGEPKPWGLFSVVGRADIVHSSSGV